MINVIKYLHTVRYGRELYNEFVSNLLLPELTYHIENWSYRRYKWFKFDLCFPNKKRIRINIYQDGHTVSKARYKVKSEGITLFTNKHKEVLKSILKVIL